MIDHSADRWKLSGGVAPWLPLPRSRPLGMSLYRWVEQLRPLVRRRVLSAPAEALAQPTDLKNVSRGPV